MLKAYLLANIRQQVGDRLTLHGHERPSRVEDVGQADKSVQQVNGARTVREESDMLHP